MNETPSWITTYLERYRALLGIGHEWHITHKVVDHPNRDPSNAAGCWPDTTYYNARIEIARDVHDDLHGKRVLLHEVWHIAHAEVDRAVDYLVEQLPPAQQTLLRQLYDEAVERFIQRTTRAMVRTLSVWEVYEHQTE